MENEKTAQEKVKPKHYQANNGIEVFDVLEMFEITDHYIATAMTYLFRAGKKEGESQADDINKAISYLQRKANPERSLIISLQPLPPTMKYVLQTVETQASNTQAIPENHEAKIEEEVGVEYAEQDNYEAWLGQQAEAKVGNEEKSEEGNEVLRIYEPEPLFDADKFKTAVEGQNLN